MDSRQWCQIVVRDLPETAIVELVTVLRQLQELYVKPIEQTPLPKPEE